MIRVFSGSDRAKIAEEVKKVLGEGYEVFDGENLTEMDIMNICVGSSILNPERKILVKDLTPVGKKESAVDGYAEMMKYPEVRHEIVIWETNLSRKKTYKDFIARKDVTAQKFDLATPANARDVFNIFDVALRDGPKAVAMLEKIEENNDPYQFMGLLTKNAIDKYSFRYGAREKRILKELSELDMQMKSSGVEPWSLVKGFLLRLSSI